METEIRYTPKETPPKPPSLWGRIRGRLIDALYDGEANMIVGILARDYHCRHATWRELFSRLLWDYPQVEGSPLAHILAIADQQAERLGVPPANFREKLQGAFLVDAEKLAPPVR